MSEFTIEMIREAAAGNQTAIAQLYEPTYNSVYKTVRSMIADEDAALDIVQDSYIKGFQNLNQLDTPEHFRAWMKRIAVNKAKDHLKKKRPVLFSEMTNEDDEEIDFRDEHLDHCPEEVLDHKETTRLMQDILSTLSEEQRLVIGMFYYEEMTVREIAEVLGCSENTVKSRLNYGRKKIEAQVNELEKRGTKLYALSPVAFLLWLFRMDANAVEVPSAVILEAVTAECAATGIAAVGSAGTAAMSAASATAAKTAAGVGAKALFTKIAAGVLAVTVLGGGTALAVHSIKEAKNDSAPQSVFVGESETESAVDTEENTVSLPAETENTEPEASPTPAPEETAPVITAEEAYRGVLDNYISAMQADSEAFLNHSDTYFHDDYSVLRYYHVPSYRSDIHYAYYDIDKNGVDELLIGCGPEGYITPIDLYCIEDTRAVQLIHEPSLGDRSHLTIMPDGTMYFHGASSAAESVDLYWKLEGSKLVEVSPCAINEVTDIEWQLLSTAEETADAPAAAFTFDEILADIQNVVNNISKEDYDANRAYYDALYPRLDSSIMWMLTHREKDVYTTAVWSAYMDMDGDGHDDLLIGRSERQYTVYPDVIFTHSGEIIYGDAIYEYTEPLYGGSVPTDWEYLCG